ncbi:kinase-like protein [Hesseltinella vesiculosa]|uniref:non-specific serine/threonine protein kinase n=1 Tax=Hesseltinella vesiculosa TaxID=101127 RepID=A0A1X2GBI3_9FUNG|nr:kinase-like protein [Hesseltinella vesiculosa]
MAALHRARSYRTPPSASSSDDDDQIMALPSPLPTHDSYHPHHHHHQPPHQKLPSPIPSIQPEPTSPVTPPLPPALLPGSASIPIIAISPSIPHHHDDIIPQLADHPMLGDMDDVQLLHQHSSHDDPVDQPSPASSSSTSSLVFHHLHSPPNQTPTRPAAAMVREASRPLHLPPSITDDDEDLVNKQLGDFYIRRLLGMGAFSKVYLAERPTPQGDIENFAIKTINKFGMYKDPRILASIEREVGVLKFIDHPNIVHIEATMETEHSLCIVLEYAQGVELFDFVQKLHTSGTPLDEVLIRKIFLQLIHVVQWMHRHNIVHRDLKPENILIHMDDHHQPHLKITDFGLARVIDPHSPILHTRCGSEEYAAPEIVQSKGYDGRQTDTWALGVILYALLTGHLPFSYDATRGERVTQLFYRIVRSQVKWPKDWDLAYLSDARQLVEKILVRQPELRISLDEMEQLDWFS